MTGIATKIIAGLVLLVLAFGLLWVSGCVQAGQRAAQDRVEDAQQGATVNSARDAIQTQGEVSARDKQSEEIGRQNEREIRGAEGSTDRVDPRVNDAGLRALCRRAAYRNRAECRVLVPSAAGVAE